MKRTRGFIMGVFLVAICGCASMQSPAAARGTVRFDSNISDAELYVNETRLGQIGLYQKSGILLKPGEHRVLVKKSGYFPLFKLITVEKRTVQLVKIEMTPIPVL